MLALIHRMKSCPLGRFATVLSVYESPEDLKKSTNPIREQDGLTFQAFFSHMFLKDGVGGILTEVGRIIVKNEICL